MGVFSWLSSTASKSKAAVIIHQAFEHYKKTGLMDGDPAKLANHVVEAACARAPGLESQYSDYILAVTCLTMALADSRTSSNLHFVCTQALQRFHVFLMQAVEAGQIQLTESQRSIFEKSLAVLNSVDKPNPNIKLSEPDPAPESVAVDVEKFARITGRRAILIDATSSLQSASMEFEYMTGVLAESGEWSILSQSMVQEDQFIYDKAEVMLKDGSTKTFWFDITDSWHRWSSNA